MSTPSATALSAVQWQVSIPLVPSNRIRPQPLRKKHIAPLVTNISKMAIVEAVSIALRILVPWVKIIDRFHSPLRNFTIKAIKIQDTDICTSGCFNILLSLRLI